MRGNLDQFRHKRASETTLSCFFEKNTHLWHNRHIANWFQMGKLATIKRNETKTTCDTLLLGTWIWFTRLSHMKWMWDQARNSKTLAWCIRQDQSCMIAWYNSPYPCVECCGTRSTTICRSTLFRKAAKISAALRCTPWAQSLLHNLHKKMCMNPWLSHLMEGEPEAMHEQKINQEWLLTSKTFLYSATVQGESDLTEHSNSLCLWLAHRIVFQASLLGLC